MDFGAVGIMDVLCESIESNALSQYGMNTGIMNHSLVSCTFQTSQYPTQVKDFLVASMNKSFK